MSDNSPSPSKLNILFADKRSFCKRMLLAGSVALAFCFSFLFFGPLELVAFGGGSFSYSYHDILLPLGIVALSIFIVSTLVLSLLRGRIFNYVIGVLLALTISGYMQGMFMNGALGALTGDAIDWGANRSDMLLNLLIWAGVIVSVFTLMYFSRELWKKATVFVSILLVIMQAVPTFAIFSGAYEETHTSDISEYALTETGMTEFSHNGNILVIVLDRLDYDYIDLALAAKPDLFESYDGFTLYSNAISAYARTQPALVHMLTGYEEAYNIPVDEYYHNAWEYNGDNIFDILSERGYSIEAYTTLSYLFRDTDVLTEHIANASNGKGEFVYAHALPKLLELSAYRYAPIALKPFFWADTNYYNSDVYASEEYTVYQFNDSFYAEKLYAGSTADREERTFKFIHFMGPHAPYHIYYDGSLSESPTNPEAQTVGSFVNLAKLFARMKELGIYEDTAIIIAGDHGIPVDDMQPISKQTRIGLFYKPAGAAEIPLKISSAQVCSANIPATILKAAGVDESPYGPSLDEIPEDAEIIRRTYKSITNQVEVNEIISQLLKSDASPTTS